MDDCKGKTEEFYRLLVENSLDLVLVLDEEGTVRYIAPSVERLLGYSPQELLGRKVFEFIHPQDREFSERNLRLALRRPGVTQYSLQRIKHKEGTWWYHQASSINLLRHPAIKGLLINSRDITRQMAVEEELRESKREMATLLSNLPGMAYRCRNDPRWTMLFVSQGCRELTGYEPEDLLNNAIISYAELIYPGDRDRVWREVQEALAVEKPFRLIYRIHTASGERKWVWEQGRGVFAEDGKLLHLEGFITDVTERMRAERLTRLQRDLALIASSSFDLGSFMDQAVQSIVQAAELESCAIYLENEDGDGFRLHAQVGFDSDLSVTSNVIKGGSPLAETLNEGRAIALAWSDLAMAAGLPKGEEGEKAAVVPLRLEGRVAGCLIVRGRHDMTPGVLDFLEIMAGQVAHTYARHSLLSRLKNSESRYRLLYEHVGEAIFSFDRELRLTGLNRRACEIIGYTEEELLGRNLLETGIVHHRDFDKVLQIVGALLSGEDTHVREIRLVRKDGSVILAEVTGASLRDTEGKIAEIVNTVRDITESRRAEEALRRSEERYRATFEATGTAMFHVDRDAVITDVNRESEKLFGYAREEMVGKLRYMDLLMPEDVEKVKNISRGLVKGMLPSPQQCEIKARHKSGRPIPALITVSMIPGIPESVVSLLDISEKKAYENELKRRAEQMRDFLDVAAHELRHPAALLKGYAMTLEKYGKRMNREAWSEALRAIENGADRLVTVVEELLETSKLERGLLRMNLEEVEVETLAKKAIEDMRVRVPDREIKLRIDPNLRFVKADAERLLRLLIILLDNAIKYSPRGTPVEVTVEMKGEQAIFSVLDRGVGIPEKDRERIFDRFYQVGDVLHHAVPGLGLGLYIGKNIVELHHGKIWYEARPGGGSVFRFTIPLRD